MQNSKDTLKMLEKALNNIKLPRTDKVMIASSYYSLCMEHQRSILSLIEMQLFGSASALLRCVFESYVKGLWFYYCATENDIELLRKDKFQKTFGLLVKDIEDRKSAGLSIAKKTNWSNLNNLTHAGPAQISRRISEHEICPTYSEDFIRDTLAFANNFGLLAAGELALISNDQGAKKAVLDASEAYQLLDECL